MFTLFLRYVDKVSSGTPDYLAVKDFVLDLPNRRGIFFVSSRVNFDTPNEKLKNTTEINPLKRNG